MTPTYSQGQPVTCILFDGAWVIDNARLVIIKNIAEFYRYTIRQGERYESDIPEVLLSPHREKPQLRLLS